MGYCVPSDAVAAASSMSSPMPAGVSLLQLADRKALQLQSRASDSNIAARGGELVKEKTEKGGGNVVKDLEDDNEEEENNDNDHEEEENNDNDNEEEEENNDND